MKKRVWIHKKEVVEGILVKDDSKIRFYSCTYLVNERGGWKPYVRWDNWDRQPHVDKYDANGALTEQKPCNEKNFDDIVKLVKIFRRNLLTMEISQL
ncbi:MAG: hypothetical protein L0213_03850 [Candidatus Dadabacteria bacterium]|nr:hypothetical protein [Candidatus Dadabacteria bacterium]